MMSFKDHPASSSSSFLHAAFAGVNVRQTAAICLINSLCLVLILSLFLSPSALLHKAAPDTQQQQQPLGLADVRAQSLPAASDAGSAQLPAAASCPPPPPPPPPCPAAAASAPAAARNAIIGLASNVAYNYLYHFVRSARAACGCSVLLFLPTADLTPQVKEMLDFFTVDVVLYDAMLAKLPARHQAFHPSSTRWLLMWDHLSTLSPPPYDALLLTDVRDVVFQRDPFAAIVTQGAGLYVAMESALVSIANEGWNSGWIRDCFGETTLRRVGQQTVSCSGTTLGTWDAAMRYLRLMAEQIREHEACERNGIDQGVHNVIVHTAMMGTGHAVYQESNERGLIATVQSMPTLRRNEWGYVLNEAGQVVSIVHQVDRSKQLLAQYDQQFPLVPPGQRNVK